MTAQDYQQKFIRVQFLVDCAVRQPDEVARIYRRENGLPDDSPVDKTILIEYITRRIMDQLIEE